MLEAEDAGLPAHARRKLGADEQRKHVAAFAAEYAPYDWTKLLDEPEPPPARG
jgi:hypothetical protein